MPSGRIAFSLEQIGDSAEIPDFPGYRIARDGRVFSCHGRIRTEGKMRSCLTDRWLPMKSKPNHNGYQRLQLRRFDGKKRNFLVHVLVATVFHGPKPEGMEVRHLNGDQDDRPDNLRWGTAVENAEDRRIHGTLAMGEAHSNAKLTESDVVEMLLLATQGLTAYALAKMFRINRSTAKKILERKAWKHVAHLPEVQAGQGSEVLQKMG